MNCKSLLLAVTMAAMTVPTTWHFSKAEYYYSLDSAVLISPSDKHITIQFDTTGPIPQESQFFANHPCLDDTVEIQHIARGFSVYGIDAISDFDTAFAELAQDESVKRCLPVYAVIADSVEFPVTDLISVQFDESLSIDSALGILSSFGLHFVDSSAYRHLFWRAALDDSIVNSPLDYANELHLLAETEWSTPTMHVRPVLMGLPSDSFFNSQYWLRNVGQTGGATDCDIDADSAWLFTLADPGLLVAVIDEGGEDHEDLDDAGLPYGRDFSYYDSDPAPGDHESHGMACAGILGATHNSVGVAGVHPGCHIVPIKIFDNNGRGAQPDSIADAIYYANAIGCRVASNSWGYGTIAPVPAVQSAIQYVSNRCGGGGAKTPQAGLGTAMIFAAGNVNNVWPYLPVLFPANMPEVIAVGAIDKSNSRWDYSCKGSALDIMAPSGDVGLKGDMYTVDMEGDRGWNPYYRFTSNDAGVNTDYTRSMGGTSGACPQVAGIASLLTGRYSPHVSYCNPGPDIRNILINSADDIAAAGWDDSTGYGRANAHKALVSIGHGDVNGDAAWDIADVVGVIDRVFRGAPQITLHPALSDVNCDGVEDVLDVTGIIEVAFRGGEAPDPCFVF